MNVQKRQTVDAHTTQTCLPSLFISPVRHDVIPGIIVILGAQIGEGEGQRRGNLGEKNYEIHMDYSDKVTKH